MSKIIGIQNNSFYVGKDGSFIPFGVVLADSMERMKKLYKKQQAFYNQKRLQWLKAGLVK